MGSLPHADQLTCLASLDTRPVYQFEHLSLLDPRDQLGLRRVDLRSGACRPSTIIAGINGVNVSGAAVMVNSNGQLGVVSSSRRYKEDIQPMGDASSSLMRLRPVTFRYKKPYADGAKPIQYGLIAEEVAETMPDLTVFNGKGQPETVKYHLLPTFLLAAYQQDHKAIQAQAGQIEQERQINQARAEQVAALERRLNSLETRLARQAPHTAKRHHQTRRARLASVQNRQ